jgi:hypothetical protein
MFRHNSATLAQLDEDGLYNRLAESVIHDELVAMKRIEEEMAEASEEVNALSQKINEEKPKDSYKKLKEILSDHVSRLAGEVARKNINSLLESISFRGTKKFVNYIDEVRMDIPMPWKILQGSYAEIIEGYVNGQLQEANVAAIKIKLVKNYYQKLIVEFAQSKMLELAAAQEKSVPSVDNDTNELNDSILYGLADTAIRREMQPVFEKLVKRLVKEKLLQESDVKQIRELMTILNTENPNFSDLEHKLDEFRVRMKIDAMKKTEATSLYDFLPETGAERLAKEAKNITKTDQKDYVIYRQFLKDVVKKAKTDETLQKIMAELRVMIEACMTQNVDIGENNPLYKKLAEMKFLDLADIVKIMELIKILSEKNRLKEEENILKNDLLTSRLNDIVVKESARQAEVNLSPESKLQFRDELRTVITNILANEEKLPAIIHKVSKTFLIEEENQLLSCIAVADDMQKRSLNLIDQAAQKIDDLLLDQLRDSLLHAAKLYMPPKSQSGITAFIKTKLHERHHGNAAAEALEKESVRDFIRSLYSPDIKDFKDAVKATKVFLLTLKGALHSNSFDTILLKILYNDGNPLGLFKLNLHKVIASGKQNFQGYPPTANDYYNNREFSQYLRENFKLIASTAIKGSVVELLEGSKNRKENRRIVRDQALVNLVKLSKLANQHGLHRLVTSSVASEPGSLNNSSSSSSSSSSGLGTRRSK